MSETTRYRALLAALTVLVVLLFMLSLTVGPAAIAFGDSMRALFSDKADEIVLIMREIRLPRALLGLMVGATLGLSGAALQGYLRNPLAEPGLIGVSASASLGAVLAIYSGLTMLFPFALPLAALAGAMVAVIVVQALAGGRGSTLTIILAGVAVSSSSSVCRSSLVASGMVIKCSLESTCARSWPLLSSINSALLSLNVTSDGGGVHPSKAFLTSIIIECSDATLRVSGSPLAARLSGSSNSVRNHSTTARPSSMLC